MDKLKDYIKTLLKLAIQNNPEVLKVVRNAKATNLVVQNYNQNQPRVPKGNPNGGQFAKNTVDLTNYFTSTPTMKEVKEFLNKMVEEGKEFATSSPDWFVDIPSSSRKKDHIAKSSQFQRMNKSQKNRHNKYVMALEDLLGSAQYLNPSPNKKPLEKPNTQKYHYFISEVKIGDKTYKILFDTEEYKGDSTIKPQTVHLYDVKEVKNSSLSANVQPSVKNLKEESNNIIPDNHDDFNPSIQNEKWISIKKGDEVVHLPLDGNNKIDTKRIEQWKEAERGIKQELGDKVKKVEVEEPKDVDKKEKDFTVKKETQKAVLLSKDGVEFWTPKRFYKDGELTPAGKEIYENARSLKDTTDELEKNGVEFEPSWESEKAYGVDTYFEDYNGKIKPVRVFIPKSQIMKNGNIPLWLFKKKIEELNEKVGFAANKGDYGSGFKTNFYKGKIVTNSKETVYTILDGELYEFEAEDFNPDIKNNVQNNKEQDMALIDELKKLITKVENDKGEDMDENEVKNEKVDKRKLIDEVAGIMKSAGADDEKIRTAIAKMEKLAYDKSEAGTADNEKEDEPKDDNPADNSKVKNEESKEDEKKYDDLKKDVKEDSEAGAKGTTASENKCKNSVDNAKGGYFDKMNEIYNAATQPAEENTYISREQKLKYAEEYFAK